MVICHFFSNYDHHISMLPGDLWKDHTLRSCWFWEIEKKRSESISKLPLGPGMWCKPVRWPDDRMDISILNDIHGCWILDYCTSMRSAWEISTTNSLEISFSDVGYFSTCSKRLVSCFPWRITSTGMNSLRRWCLKRSHWDQQELKPWNVLSRPDDNRYSQCWLAWDELYINMLYDWILWNKCTASSNKSAKNKMQLVFFWNPEVMDLFSGRTLTKCRKSCLFQTWLARVLILRPYRFGRRDRGFVEGTNWLFCAHQWVSKLPVKQLRYLNYLRIHRACMDTHIRNVCIG